MTVLIDTNVLVAFFNQRDANFNQALRLLGSLGDEQRLIVSSVMTEMFYLLAKRRHYMLAVQAIKYAAKAFQIVELEEKDIEHMVTIMEQYQETKLDYTDAAIMAVSERLNITRIATFDRRDFEIVRPTHISHYELLP